MNTNDLADLNAVVAKVRKYWTVCAYKAAIGAEGDVGAVIVAKKVNDARFYTIRATGSRFTQADVEFSDRTDSLEKAIALLDKFAKRFELVGEVIVEGN